MSGKPETTVDLYMQAFTPCEARREEVVERLQRLVASTALDGLRVHTWANRVSLSEDASPDVVGTFHEFEDWAERNHVSLRPPFEVREYDSSLSGEAGRVLFTPVVCVVVYRDDELVMVCPHTDDGTAYTVDDLLSELEGGRGDSTDEETTKRTIW